MGCVCGWSVGLRWSTCVGGTRPRPMGPGFVFCMRRVWTSGRSEGRVVVRRLREEEFSVIYETRRGVVVLRIVRDVVVKRAAQCPTCELSSNS
jgi:hypothetical protein